MKKISAAIAEKLHYPIPDEFQEIYQAYLSDLLTIRKNVVYWFSIVLILSLIHI